MLFADEFTDELTAFVTDTLKHSNEKQTPNSDWHTQLRTKIRALVDKYGIGNGESSQTRSRGQSFFIGDESSSTSASIVGHDNEAPSMADAQVQVNLLPTTPTVTPTRTPTPKTAKNEEDAKILAELRDGRLKHRQLEQRCSPAKAVELRRLYLEEHHRLNLDALPFERYDYSEVKDACCENVIGFMPLPTGIAGPLRFDNDELVPIPLCTTEGALVASVSRGCLCINESIGLLGADAFFAQVIRSGMSRAPVLEFDKIPDAVNCYQWVQQEDTFTQLKRSFEETSSFACLKRVDPHLEGNYLFLRFVATTGDAMGMNMVTKGTGRALALIKREFPQARLISISGNFCVDKKPSALNWIEGRGKSVVAEAFIPAVVVERVLKTSVDKMVKLGHAKLLVGSSASCTVGGWNAHAANVVAAMFLATGQDAAQVVSSSMCMTQLGRRPEDGALRISCTMNCLEVGTIGGGTVLSAQSACLEMLGCRRAGQRPGQNAERLARLICSTVLAGELSLLASQCNEGDLERTHLRLNRSNRNLSLMNNSQSAYPLVASPNTPSILLPASPCKKSSSMIALQPPIPEHQTIPQPVTSRHSMLRVIDEQRRPQQMREEQPNRTRGDTVNSTASSNSTPNELLQTRESRSRSTLSQASAKLLKKAHGGHMPCGPL